MSDLLTDCIIRISRAEPDELRAIYQREIQAPIWLDEEREQLLEAWGMRSSYWNAREIGMQNLKGRWT